jgi:hypothetical protein
MNAWYEGNTGIHQGLSETRLMLDNAIQKAENK